MKLKVCIFWVSMKLSQYFISIKVSHKWHLIFAIFPYAGKLLQIPLCYFLPIGALGSDFWVTRRREWTLLNHTRCFCEIDKTNRQRPNNIHCLTLARHIHAIKILNYKLFHSQVFGAHFDYTQGNWLIAHITIKSRFQNPNQLCM